MRRLSALFVGVDGGPRETLLAVANESGVRAETAFSDAPGFWTERLSEARAAMVVTGTSETLHGRACEHAALKAAHCAGLPVAAIEDYPGNYSDEAGAEADLLFVEGDAAADLVRRRLGSKCPRLATVSPARFDTLRRDHMALRRWVRDQWAVGQGAGEPTSLVWIGQPETADCLATLEVVLPFLSGNGFRLLFRAHPRDKGYVSGAYREIARKLGTMFHDVTHMRDDEVFLLAPRLAITQYSSMIIQAGFYGIPSVCLLFPGAGGGQLEAKKSCRVPLPCLAGAFRVCAVPSVASDELGASMGDESLREGLISGFDVYYSTGNATAPKTVAALKTLL